MNNKAKESQAKNEKTVGWIKDIVLGLLPTAAGGFIVGSQANADKSTVEASEPSC